MSHLRSMRGRNEHIQQNSSCVAAPRFPTHMQFHVMTGTCNDGLAQNNKGPFETLNAQTDYLNSSLPVRRHMHILFCKLCTPLLTSSSVYFLDTRTCLRIVPACHQLYICSIFRTLEVKCAEHLVPAQVPRCLVLALTTADQECRCDRI